MSSTLITMRFPDGRLRYEVSEHKPSLGEIVRRNGESWVVSEVSNTADGSLSVVLSAEGDARVARSSLRDELLDRAAQTASGTADETRAVANEARLREDDEERNRQAWNLPARSR